MKRSPLSNRPASRLPILVTSTKACVRLLPAEATMMAKKDPSKAASKMMHDAVSGGEPKVVDIKALARALARHYPATTEDEATRILLMIARKRKIGVFFE